MELLPKSSRITPEKIIRTLLRLLFFSTAMYNSRTQYIVGSSQAFIQALLSTAIFSQRLNFFTVKEDVLTFGSLDPWKMHFQRTFWLQRTSCTWLINAIFLREYYGLVIKYTKSHHPNRRIKVGNKPPRLSWLWFIPFLFNQTWPGHSVILSSDFSFSCMNKNCSISVIYS